MLVTVQLSVLSSRWSLSKSDTSQESGVVGHIDECVLMSYAYIDLLASAEWAHTSRVAGVEFALARLNAASTAEEWAGVHHHIIAGNVSEVEVVHLVNGAGRGRGRGAYKSQDFKVCTTPHDNFRGYLKLKQLQY